MFSNVDKNKQKIDTQKTQEYIISLARKKLEKIQLYKDIEDMVESEYIIENFATLLHTDPARLAMSDAQIENLLKKLAAKQLLQTYLAIYRMSSIEIDEYPYSYSSLEDKIFNIAVSIKYDYTKQQSETLVANLINNKNIFKLVANKQIDQAKCIIHNIIEKTTGTIIPVNSIEQIGVIKSDDKKTEALIGTSPAINIANDWKHIPIAKIISPNVTPINSPGTSPDTNAPAEMLFSKKSNFSYGYPAIPGDSPFVTPENSPQKQKQQGPILNAACKNSLIF